MSKKTVLLLSLLPLALVRPAFADTTAPDQQPAPADKPGLMTRFAKLFDVFDTTKPENQHVFVIGTSTPKPAAPANPPAAEAAVGMAPAASTPASSNSAQAAPPPAPGAAHGHGFKLSSGFQTDDGQATAAATGHPAQ
jgi:hypothetical protein